ncbi:hypothetical protein GCM10007304_35570 [Rhodococcoides trifolii]|uniref:Integral membrane protein n=1 Tax=Rhodococcoides trifolii TaxID=908250 RepID=A0A917G1M8_9NOCA|nr:hypothetical protein [Rhodococcus trifolii]GGG18499.1 hypothetical protein GCM10007304_35570 [Rhodococcus trifolii]
MPLPRRLRTLHRYVTTRPQGILSTSRASARLSAYVYGNVLVLAVVVAASTSSIDDGSATALALGTTVTTFLAHIFSDGVASAMLPEEDRSRRHRLEELRDSVPIVSSGTIPTVLLGLGWLQIVPTGTAQIAASALITVRIASIPIVAQRLRGERLSWRAVAIGITLAVAATVVVFVKVLLTH